MNAPLRDNLLGRLTLKCGDCDLIIRQCASIVRVTSQKDRDRKALDPPPIIQMRVKEYADPALQSLQNPYIFMVATLINSTRSPYAIEFPPSRSLVGGLVSSLHRLKDLDNCDAGFFVFGDLGVKIEGEFRLKFSVYEMRDKEVVYIQSVLSDDFGVHSPRTFPGLQQESTLLSRSFADQGVKMRIRKEPRTYVYRGRKRSSGIPPPGEYRPPGPYVPPPSRSYLSAESTPTASSSRRVSTSSVPIDYMDSRPYPSASVSSNPMPHTSVPTAPLQASFLTPGTSHPEPPPPVSPTTLPTNQIPPNPVTFRTMASNPITPTHLPPNTSAPSIIPPLPPNPMTSGPISPTSFALATVPPEFIGGDPVSSDSLQTEYTYAQPPEYGEEFSVPTKRSRTSYDTLRGSYDTGLPNQMMGGTAPYGHGLQFQQGSPIRQNSQYQQGSPTRHDPQYEQGSPTRHNPQYQHDSQFRPDPQFHFHNPFQDYPNPYDPNLYPGNGQ